MRQCIYTCVQHAICDVLQVSTDDAQAYADENGLVYWETSAKTNANVSELFDDIAKRCARCRCSSLVVPLGKASLVVLAEMSIASHASKVQGYTRFTGPHRIVLHTSSQVV